MNIALFTPCIEKSSIGRDSLHVERELLALGHHVTIVRIEDEGYWGTTTHPYISTVLRWDDVERLAGLRTTVDMAVYQIGNNFAYHRGALEWLPEWPGVVCLHDYYLGDLFWAWANGRREVATTVLRKWYGQDIASVYFSTNSSEELIEKTHAVAPLSEWVSSQALGVLTHSSWNIQRVLKACPGPVHVAGVPTGTLHLEQPSAKAPSRHTSKPDKKNAKTQFTVLTVGHANPNKRSESVIKAIGSSKRLKSNSSYHLAGPIEPGRAKHLSELAANFGVDIKILGQVDNATLAQEIRDADVLCCLRYPTLEAASGSTIEAMLSGKATVVTDAGFYTEIPDQCVRKVQIEHEVESLRGALEFLYDRPDERVAIGERARDWAERAFDPKNYAVRLLEVCRLATGVQAQIQAGQFFANILAGWGATPDILKASGALPWIEFNDLGIPAREQVMQRPDRNGDMVADGTSEKEGQEMVAVPRQANR